MTTFEAMIAGGEDGVAVTPGKAADSPLYALMTSTDARKMPPAGKGAPVAPASAEVIKRWIVAGAKLDEAVKPSANLTVELRRRWVPPAPPAKYARPIPVTAMAFSRDGRSIFTSGHHEVLKWDASTGALQNRLKIRAERVFALEVLDDNHIVYAGGRPGQEGEVRIVHADGKPGLRLWDGDDCSLALAIDRERHRLAAAGTDRTIRVWDVSDFAKPKLLQSIDSHADWVLGLAFSRDGKQLFSAGRDKTVKAWDFAKKESVFTMSEHDASVIGVTLAADDKLGFSLGGDKLLRAWKPSADAKAIKSSARHAEEPVQLLAHPTMPVIVTAAGPVVQAWNSTEKLPKLRDFTGVTTTNTALAFSPDGERLAAATHDGRVWVWTFSDAKLIANFSVLPGLR